MKIKLVGLDPALSNLGIAWMTYDTDTGLLELERTWLVHTEKSEDKKIKTNSDDLARASLLFQGMIDACQGRDVVVAEIPTGTQSARGAMSNGIVIGVLSACPMVLLEVSPADAKAAGPGIKNATKDEMIEWAMAKYPHTDWRMRKLGGVMVPKNDNEHMADACAIVEAGILRPEFTEHLPYFSSLK